MLGVEIFSREWFIRIRPLGPQRLLGTKPTLGSREPQAPRIQRTLRLE